MKIQRMAKMSEIKSFLNPGLSFRLIHYIENRAKQGHTYGDIRKDLLRGHSSQLVDRHINYVETHKAKIPLHSFNWHMLFFGAGVFCMLMIGGALWWYIT
jgi:hypothetical protein